jgi:murein DD-endopeptidase MepM/ murein hydrolase activator NlpD
MKYLFLSLLFSFLTIQLYAQHPAGGGEYKHEAVECVPTSLRIQIEEDLQKNIHQLKASGKIKPGKKTRFVGLEWPLKQASGFNYCSYYGISNFVDHNLAYPNQVLDYNCGSRSYDLNTGYNHGGVDIYLWPFDWNMKNASQVEIIAAAPGIIVNKYDGNPDSNCNFSNPNWNAVFIQHADGSVAWYGHMKNGSLTTKQIGDPVSVGEKIGLVGSSGSSTAPHLHFELHDASNNLIDPYTGTCNVPTSWWNTQKPYYESTINAAFTHSAAPVFNPCPAPATTNRKDTFLANELVYFIGYFHDNEVGQVATYTIYQPNNSVFATWTHSPPLTYSSSYWYWTYNLPLTPMLGTWKFDITLLGQTCSHSFEVIDPFIAASTSDLEKSKMHVYPNPVKNWLKVENPEYPIQLMTIYGQLLYNTFTESLIDVSNLTDGMYIIKAGNQYQKISIQHNE